MTAGMRASRVEWSHLVVSILSVERWLHRIRRNYFARSRASRTALNREQHAAEACTLPFMAGRDRPRPGFNCCCASPDPPTKPLVAAIYPSAR